MSKYRVMLLASFLLVIVAAAAEPANAQGRACADENNCESCLILWREGIIYEEPGYDISQECLFIGVCGGCVPDPSVSQDLPSVHEIIGSVSNAPPDGLKDVVDTFRTQLVLDPTRNLLAIRGSACNPAALTAVVYLSSERSAALKELGVQELADFLAELGAENR